MSIHDKRLHAVRSDLADARLQGEVDAARFVAGRPARIIAAVADIRAAPAGGSGVLTQFILGEDVLIFEEKDGVAWIQGERDGYVGYVDASAIGSRDTVATHLVSVPRTFLYPGPDMKLARIGELSMGSVVQATDFTETRGTCYAALASGGFAVANHLRPLAEHAADSVSVAETLLQTPYLWGGTTAFGIDCSGLVQLSHRMAGRSVLRDTDMQAGSIGEPIDAGRDYSGLRRGDLVFWKGHVAIMTDGETIIHANGHTMMVSSEGLREAVDRIGYLYGLPTALRRP